MAFIPIQEYKLTVDGTTTAETAVAIALPAQVTLQSQLQAVIRAKTTDIVVKFGDSSVVADATLSGTSRVAGNFVVPADASYIVNLANNHTYFSAIAEDEATTGTLYVTVGYNSNA